MELSIPNMCDLDREALYGLFVNISVVGSNGTADGVDGGGGGNESASAADDEALLAGFLSFEASHHVACAQHRFDLIVSRLVPVIFAIIVVLGVVGNSLVLVVVLCGQQMRNTTNVLILNLSLSDLLFVTICIPPTAVDYAIGWPFGNFWCKVVQYLIHATTYGSVYTLVLLSLDRYLAVCYPVKSISLRTVANTSVAIVVTWIAVLAVCAPILFVFGGKDIEFAHGEVRSICTFDRVHYSEQLYQSLFFLTSLAIPLLAIMWLYMNMLLRLWRGSAAAHGPGPARDRTNSGRGQENKKRVTRMVVIVIIAFAICWTPLQVVLMLRNFNMYDITENGGLIVLQIVTHCLAYCNSCLNPILYAFFSPNFRSAFLNTCRSRRGGNGAVVNGLDRTSRANHSSKRALSAAAREIGGSSFKRRDTATRFNGESGGSVERRRSSGRDKAGEEVRMLMEERGGSASNSGTSSKKVFITSRRPRLMSSSQSLSDFRTSMTQISLYQVGENGVASRKSSVVAAANSVIGGKKFRSEQSVRAEAPPDNCEVVYKVVVAPRRSLQQGGKAATVKEEVSLWTNVTAAREELDGAAGAACGNGSAAVVVTAETTFIS